MLKCVFVIFQEKFGFLLFTKFLFSVFSLSGQRIRQRRSWMQKDPPQRSHSPAFFVLWTHKYSGLAFVGYSILDCHFNASLKILLKLLWLRHGLHQHVFLAKENLIYEKGHALFTGRAKLHKTFKLALEVITQCEQQSHEKFEHKPCMLLV